MGKSVEGVMVWSPPDKRKKAARKKKVQAPETD
jgi:hypothetical protein